MSRGGDQQRLFVGKKEPESRRPGERGRRQAWRRRARPHYLCHGLSISSHQERPKGHWYTDWMDFTDVTSSVTPSSGQSPQLRADSSRGTPSIGFFALRTRGMWQEISIALKVFVFHSINGKRKRDFSPNFLFLKMSKLQKNCMNSTMSISSSSHQAAPPRVHTWQHLHALSLLCVCVCVYFQFFCWTICTLVAVIMVLWSKYFSMELPRTRKQEYSPT